jgi:hypothetical protein
VILHDKHLRAVITRSSPIQRPWLMEHFNRPPTIMINDVESTDFYRRSVWMRNLIPTFKFVFISIHHCNGRVASRYHVEESDHHRLRDFTFPQLVCCWYVLLSKRWRRYVPSKRQYVKLPATQRTATQQHNTQPALYNSPLFYYKTYLAWQRLHKEYKVTGPERMKMNVSIWQCAVMRIHK